MKANLAKNILKALLLGSFVSSPLQGEFIYQFMAGHDIEYDADDNSAQLAGIYAVQRNIDAYPGQVELIGMVAGDTELGTRQTTHFKYFEQPSAADQMTANYIFFRDLGQSVLEDFYGSGNVYDAFLDKTPWNFSATDVSHIRPASAALYQKIVAAITHAGTDTYRVVYSAGGGHNVPFEAISLLRHNGYTDAQIIEHFAIVQHSTWNQDNTNEPNVKNDTLKFMIRINDQNGNTGVGNVVLDVSAAKTSPAFEYAYEVAIGFVDADPIIHSTFKGKDDASDSGSHSFATDVPVITAHWNQRDNNDNHVQYDEWDKTTMEEEIGEGLLFEAVGDLSPGVSYDYFEKTGMNSVNDLPEFSVSDGIASGFDISVINTLANDFGS